MAAIDDLIAQIDDAALRVRLKEEADRLRRDRSSASFLRNTCRN